MGLNQWNTIAKIHNNLNKTIILKNVDTNTPYKRVPKKRMLHKTKIIVLLRSKCLTQLCISMEKSKNFPKSILTILKKEFTNHLNRLFRLTRILRVSPFQQLIFKLNKLSILDKLNRLRRTHSKSSNTKIFLNG